MGGGRGGPRAQVSCAGPTAGLKPRALRLSSRGLVAAVAVRVTGRAHTCEVPEALEGITSRGQEA